MNTITMSMNVDGLILQALREDITSEDITTNAIMKKYQEGSVQLICKQDGIIAGLPVFERVFHLTDPKTEVFLFVEDGAEVKTVSRSVKCMGIFVCFYLPKERP